MISSELAVKVNGLTLSVKTWGEPDKTPVLALHGWQDNAATFDVLAPLMPDYYWIVPDLPGHGQSEHRGIDADYYLWGYCIEVLQLAKKLELDEFILLGHSMGGGIANLIAGLFPEKIIKLVLLDVLGVMTTPPAKALDQMRTALVQRVDKPLRKAGIYSTREKAVKARAKNGISQDAAALLGARGIAKKEEGYYWQHDQRLSQRSLLSMSDEQLVPVMNATTCPTLVIGSKEAVIRQEVIESRKAMMKDVRVFTLQGGHHQHMDGDVKQVASLIQEFLEEKSKA